MKLEEFDSLKFDLDLAQDEKELLETELSEIKEHVRDLESKLHQAQT
jgi:flagellar biosynthesis chaperone FliJ